MTACFIVLAHRNPAQVARLAARLAPHHVLVHVDSNVPPDAYAAFERALMPMPNVTLLRRFRSAWASWGIVEALLEGLRVAMQRTGWTHVMHLSGQDYPLVGARTIDEFLGDHAHTSFFQHFTMPNQVWGPDGGMFRLRYWHRPAFRRRLFIPIPRTIPAGLTLTGSSAYFCLTPATTRALFDFIERRPDVLRFYRHVWIPDEQFIATAIMSGPQAHTVRNASLTYIRWPPGGAAHPITWAEDGIDELLVAARGDVAPDGTRDAKLFARKFVLDDGSGIFDALDRAADAR